jgi:hypothetical protein
MAGFSRFYRLLLLLQAITIFPLLKAQTSRQQTLQACISQKATKFVTGTVTFSVELT